jgi:DNA-binding response OmpR family regulator
VDDEADVRHFLRLVLEASGYVVDCAADGREGLARIEAARPDLVLLDLMMPHLDGWGVLERLGDCPAPPSVVIVSAAPDPARAMRAGAAGCLAKPFSVAELLATCARALAP